MCLSGVKYYINLRSSSATLQKAQTSGEFAHRFSFNWNSFLRNIPHDVKYFRVKVNYFWHLKHGMDTNAVAIYCPQMESPYFYSFPRELGHPIAYARALNKVDVDTTVDERMRNTGFHCDASTSEGQVVCIRRDAYLDIIVRDASGKVDSTSPIATYSTPSGGAFPLENFNIQLVLEPYLDTDKDESECRMKDKKY